MLNIQELRQSNDRRGWTEVPRECPVAFVQKICEARSRELATMGESQSLSMRMSGPRVSGFMTAVLPAVPSTEELRAEGARLGRVINADANAAELGRIECEEYSRNKMLH